jgi:hypothetical protein
VLVDAVLDVLLAALVHSDDPSGPQAFPEVVPVAATDPPDVDPAIDAAALTVPTLPAVESMPPPVAEHAVTAENNSAK